MQRSHFIGLLLVLLVSAVSPSLAQRQAATFSINPLIGQAQVLTFSVDRPGIVTITPAMLVAAGWDTGMLPNVRVYRRGREIPVQVSARGIQFVAQANESPFSATAVYWLVAGDGPGLRAPLPANPTIPLVWEQDKLYQSIAPTGRGDRWFAGELRPGGPAISATLMLPSPAPAGSALAIALTSIVRREGHRLSVSADGTFLGEVRWDDPPVAIGPLTVTLPLARSLPAGALRLDLVLTSAGADDVFVDRLALPGVAVPLEALPPPILTAPALSWDVRAGPAPGQAGADTLILTHAAFRATLEPLIAAKQALGRSVAVLDVQVAYDAFSFGERDPEAIRSLIRAAAYWSPAPRSVLLVGAGSVRMQVAPGEEDPTFIPPYLLDIDPKYGEVACDTCYTRLDSDNPRQDPLPDLAIGRFPVRTLEEAQIVVAKTVQTLTAPSPGAWRTRALMLTDNDSESDGAPDPVGGFVDSAERAINLLPPQIQTTRFFYAPDRVMGAQWYQNSGALRRDLFTSWDAGAALLIYIGHASMWQWAFTSPADPTPHLVNLYDAEARANQGRLPILLSMACLSGNWANPILPTLDEQLLLHSGGGIAASLSPSGSGVNSGHSRILEGLLPRLFAPTRERTLGAAHLAGLASLVASGRDRDLAYSFGILGDPDITLPLMAHTIALPLIRR